MPSHRILVVEDESIVALDLRQRLEQMGFEVIATVATGAAALEQATSKNPNLILMDIQIKGEIDGIETANRITKLVDIPIVFLTANSDRSTIDRAKSAGPLAYLLKPFEDRELQTTIEIALDRHRLERKIKEHERWLTVTLASIGDAVLTFDVEGKVTYLNYVATQLTGWTNEEAQGCPAREILKLTLNESMKFKPIDPVANVLDTGKTLHLHEFALLTRRDGVQIAIEDSAAPIRLESGELIGVVMIFRDVTARILTERKLRDSEMQVQRIFETVQEGLGVVDPNERICLCNPAFARILGEVNPDAIIGKSILDYMTAESSEEVLAQTAVRQTGVSSSYELCITTPASERKIVMIHAAPLADEEGIYCGAVGAMVDITDRKRVEMEISRHSEHLEELVQARTKDLSQALRDLQDEIEERRQLEVEREVMRDKLLKAEKMEALGLLAGGVAHDLNNTLGALVGYPDLILEMLPENTPVQRMVERIRNSAKDAACVVNDLLTLARRGRYEMHPLRVTDVVSEYLDSPGFLRLQAEHPTIRVVTRLDETLPSILGSAPHLGKVVMNLVVNAFDAIRESGTVTVQVTHANLAKLESGHDRIKPGDYVIVRVSDTGCGIAKEDFPKIFEPYYSNKKMGRSGTGLGLAVVYGIIHDHSGYYDVLSEVERGTDFILYFPTTEQKVTKANTEKISGGCETLLVVDDGEEQRDLACEILSNFGYRVNSVANGREAVKYIQSNSVDLVLLDMIMEPDFDGLDTYREILKTKPQQKAIVVSGYSSTERVEELLRLGASGYLKKPYSMQSIAKAVRAALDADFAKPLQVRSEQISAEILIAVD
jgi:PAS domain S-box-containing protein